MDTTQLLPSDFTSFPWNSVSKNSETEQVCKNIMVILSRTGNTWRKMNLDEYAFARNEDGGYSSKEETYFFLCREYCLSPETALQFKHNWHTDK